MQGILNEATGEVVTGVSTWNTAVRDAVQKMVINGLTGFIDHGGHHWSPEAYVAMDVRTTMFNTARAAIWERSEQFGSDLYQVSSHNAARPLCYPWQGKVISRNDIAQTVEDIDGNQVEVIPQSATSYGEAAGLFGVNCKHYPMTFIPGFSALRGEPQDPEENAQAYAQSQEQRRLERRLREEKRDLAVMRAQGADPDQIGAQRERIRKASDDIDAFCDQTGLPRRRNREYTPVDAKWPDTDDIPPRTGGNGPSGPDAPPVQMHLGRDDIPPMGQAQNQVTSGTERGIIPMDRGMAGGNRSGLRSLTDEEKSLVMQSVEQIQADPSKFVFKDGGRTAYNERTDEINIRGDVFPDLNGTMARDRMSVAAVLAHEYYGHRANRGTKLPEGSWQDELRASMTAAIHAPGLSDTDRQLLMRDALDRASSAGVALHITPTMRRILYGY